MKTCTTPYHHSDPLRYVDPKVILGLYHPSDFRSPFLRLGNPPHPGFTFYGPKGLLNSSSNTQGSHCGTRDVSFRSSSRPRADINNPSLRGSWTHGRNRCSSPSCTRRKGKKEVVRQGTVGPRVRRSNGLGKSEDRKEGTEKLKEG